MKRCCPVSDLAGTPVAVTHIKIGSREGAAVIDVVGGPAKCDVGMQSVNQQRRISDIDDAGAGDDREGRAGVARTRYAELIDEGGRAGMLVVSITQSEGMAYSIRDTSSV